MVKGSAGVLVLEFRRNQLPQGAFQRAPLTELTLQM